MDLNQITIPVSDLERSVRFYEKLGLKLIVISSPRYARFVCPDGHSTFSLHLVDTSGVEDGIWIYFEEKDLDAYVGKLIDRGIAIAEMPTDKPWLWRECRVQDPDNHVLIIYWAGENRINPPWRLE